MPYSIHDEDGFVEVKVWGELSAFDTMCAVWELRKKDPRKKTPDLWNVSRGCVLPSATFSAIAKMVLAIIPSDKSGRRSAIVVADSSLMAAVEKYTQDVRFAPFETKAFMSRDQAIEWLKAESSPNVVLPSHQPSE